MQETINRLREQPKEHRTAIAASIAIGIVIILLVGWFFFFMHGLGKGDLEYTRQQQAVDETLDQNVLGVQASSSPIATSSAPAAGLNGY